MTAFSYVFLSLQFFLLIIGGYWLIIGFFGLGKVQKAPKKAPRKRFLILVPAHNEEKVIGNLVENLMNLDYPKELYKVCVIADNCNDKTAEISRSYGVIVLNHTSLPGEKKGKPYAIKYALDKIGDRLTEVFDAIAVFDADNLVSLNYLKEMNNHLMDGEKLIQCYLDSKNPNDNYITLGYAASYYYMNRSWQLAKYRLGLGNAIGGTGFCVDTKVMKQVGWTAKSLTEDLEFTVQCLLQGIRTTWCHSARVFDEKPEKFKASCVQRLRWARGHWDVCFKYFGKLLFRGVTKLDVRALDGALYLLNPAKALLEAAAWIMWAVGVFVFKQNYFHIFPLWLWGSLLVFSWIYIIIISGLDTKVKFSRIKAILAMMFFNYSYIPLFFWGMITCKNKTWVRTEHTKNVSIPVHAKDKTVQAKPEIINAKVEIKIIKAKVETIHTKPKVAHSMPVTSRAEEAAT